MKAVCFDYGAGNLHSLGRALAVVGCEVEIATDLSRAIAARDLVILPGVGAFGAAAERLAPFREDLRRAIESGLPCIGICLGMQLFFERSDEGEGNGIGVIAGAVTRLRGNRVPHIGWTRVGESIPANYMYFAHSFACRPVETPVVVEWSEHEGDRFPATVRAKNAIGMQFHPEKSSAAGIARLARAVKEATS